MATWHTQSTAATQWPAAATLSTDQANELLAVARSQVQSFAPALESPDLVEIPDTYRLAQLMQAKALWNAMRTGAGDETGADGFTVRVHPMDWQVKAILRPPQGFPGVS